MGGGWSLYPEVGLVANDIGRWAAGLNLGGGFDVQIAPIGICRQGSKWQPMFDDARKNPVVISVGAFFKF